MRIVCFHIQQQLSRWNVWKWNVNWCGERRWERVSEIQIALVGCGGQKPYAVFSNFISTICKWIVSLTVNSIFVLFIFREFIFWFLQTTIRNVYSSDEPNRPSLEFVKWFEWQHFWHKSNAFRSSSEFMKLNQPYGEETSMWICFLPVLPAIKLTESTISKHDAIYG